MPVDHYSNPEPVSVPEKLCLIERASGPLLAHCWCYKHNQNEHLLKKRNIFIFLTKGKSSPNTKDYGTLR